MSYYNISRRFQCEGREGGREDNFKPIIGKEILHGISNDSGVSVVNFITSKNVIFKSTTFFHRNIHKHTLTSSDGVTHNQIVQVLTGKRRHSNVLEVASFRGVDFSTIIT